MAKKDDLFKEMYLFNEKIYVEAYSDMFDLEDDDFYDLENELFIETYCILKRAGGERIEVLDKKIPAEEVKARFLLEVSKVMAEYMLPVFKQFAEIVK